MKAILLILIAFSLSCENVFSQESCLSYVKVLKIQELDKTKLKKQLAVCKKKFERKWTQANRLLGMDSIKNILSNSECHYVVMYDVKKMSDSTLVLVPSKKMISDVIFLYGNLFLGSYEQNSAHCKPQYYVSATKNYPDLRSDYTQYTKMDGCVIQKFLNSDNGVFSINCKCTDFIEIGMYWFSCEENGRLRKYDKYSVQSTIFEINR